MKADKYYHLFVEAGMIDSVRKWLTNNPPLENWESTEWSWAYTEMMISNSQRSELKAAKKRLLPAYKFE